MVSLIDDYASRLNLPVQVIIEAKLIAERSIVKDIALGYRPEEVAAVSIYVACRRNKVPLSFREVVKTTRVSRVKLGNLYKRILIHL
ncbi:MAG: cyclin family protein, partial [Desulfurococcaceae archaeon]